MMMVGGRDDGGGVSKECDEIKTSSIKNLTLCPLPVAGSSNMTGVQHVSRLSHESHENTKFSNALHCVSVLHNHMHSI